MADLADPTSTPHGASADVDAGASTGAGAPAPEPTADQVRATMRDKRYVVLLLIAAIVGVVVSLATWGFLELVYQLQRELYTHLPHALGFPHGAPRWWPLPVLTLGAVVVAFAITRLPGDGGHIPAQGLAAGAPPRARELLGILLAAIATLGSGLILGPEAPLIALGSGLGILTVRLARKDAPPQVMLVVAAAGAFAAMSLIFASPVIAAVVMIEATGLGGARLPLVLLPGLLASGIGALISTGMGSFTGLSTSAYALGALQLPHFARPDVAEFGWAIALAIAVSAGTQVTLRIGLRTLPIVRPRVPVALPVIGLIVAGLIIAFSAVTGKGIEEALFSGQDQLPGLVAQAGTWSLSALALLIVFKGLGFALCLGSFRGGPTFPALFLGAASGIMASHLAGFPLTPAVAVGMAAATASMLRLPLSAVVIATLLTSKSGVGAEPLIIVGVAVAYLIALVLGPAPDPARGSAARPAAAS